MRVILCIFLALLLLGCASPPPTQQPPNQQPPNQTPGGNQTPQSGSVVVHISGFKFQPADIVVTAGTNVTWVNDDSVMHTVTADNGAFDLASMQHGDNRSFVFNQAGNYSYHCSIHLSMKGSVTVK